VLEKHLHRVWKLYSGYVVCRSLLLFHAAFYLNASFTKYAGLWLVCRYISSRPTPSWLRETCRLL